MELRITIRNSFIIMKQRKFLTFLTMLGIVIGVSSVIIVTAIGKGQATILKQDFYNYTFNKFMIDINRRFPANIYKITQSTYLTNKNVQVLKKNPNIALLSPIWKLFSRPVLVKNKTMIKPSNNTVLVSACCGPDHLKIQGFDFLYGKNFSENCNKNFVIIDNNLAMKLFGKINAIGESFSLYYRGDKYKLNVLGIVMYNNNSNLARKILDPKVNFYYFFIPYKYSQKIIGQKNILSVYGRFKKDVNFQIACEQIAKELVRLKHTPPGVFIIGPSTSRNDNYIKDINRMNNYAFLVATIVLLSGGIVIMNIMLITVSERSYEIGLRKAVGAKNRDIILQFLTEAVILTFSSGVIGIIIGIMSCFIVGIFSIAPPIIDWWIVLLAAVISVFIGIVFGIYPAYKAAKMNPIDTLRE